MQRTAVFWIRDGVLVDRMPVNAVAFAFASLIHANSTEIDLTSLINFAFETSGISCAEKMLKFNTDVLPLITDVTAAAQYYNELAGCAANHCEFFDGACELVRHLQEELGVMNFITSAVEQDFLDNWAQSRQAMPLVPHLTEILGKRSAEFSKGRAHFIHARERYGAQRIVYIADAVAEITTGAQFAHESNILPVGFANVITNEKIRQAFNQVMDAHKTLAFAGEPQTPNFALDESKLLLPDEATLIKKTVRCKSNLCCEWQRQKYHG